MMPLKEASILLKDLCKNSRVDMTEFFELIDNIHFKEKGPSHCIVLEGLDGAGKSTLANHLVETFQKEGKDAIYL